MAKKMLKFLSFDSNSAGDRVGGEVDSNMYFGGVPGNFWAVLSLPTA